MAFEDITQAAATSARSRYSGEGFRQEPDFREGTTTFEAAAVPVVAPASSESEATVTLGKRPPNLTYVFDDPAEGEPGRDRLVVHGLWELLLLVALGGAGYLLYAEQSSAFSGGGLSALLLQVTAIGLLAAGSAFALRAGAVNLAVGPIAVASALYFADNSGGGLLQPLLVVVGLTAVFGLAQGLVTVAFHVPAWAASLAGSVAVLAWIQQAQPASGPIYSAGSAVYWWFGGFCAFSVIASLVGVVPGLRRTFGRARPVSDPADRRGWTGAFIVLAATVVSAALAGVAGVLSASVGQSASASEGLLVTATAIGVALLGGTSAFGRRGGIFGTVLASGLFVVVSAYSDAAGLDWSPAALAAGALAIGLVATRLVEKFGRPSLGREPVEDDEGWLLRSHADSEAGWPNGRPYTPATPATTASGTLWASDDAWGTTDRR